MRQWSVEQAEGYASRRARETGRRVVVFDHLGRIDVSSVGAVPPGARVVSRWTPLGLREESE